MRRRPFLAALGGILASGSMRQGAARDGTEITAEPTLMHGHPDGTTTLVRFAASGVESPAGRLRVYDARTGALLGTAGMIRRGDRLAGELWLPLAQQRRVRSELDTPAGRGPVRSTHDLVPTPRWTIAWLTLAAPDAIRELFAEVPDWLRAAEASRLADAGIRVNPWRALAADADHLDLLRLTMPASRASRVTGVPLARIAIYDGRSSPHLDRALHGADVALALPRSAVVDPRMLDLSAGRGAAMSRIEAWLRARTPADPNRQPLAIAIGGDLAFARSVQPQVDDWNAAYAFPRFVVGDDDRAVRILQGGATDADPPGPPTVDRAPPDGRRDSPRVLADAFRPLTRAVAPATPTLEAFAREFAFPVGGLLVFNPSPFGRSDVVSDGLGAVRVVTDVPGMGYAFVPDAPRPPVTRREDDDGTESAHFAVRLERSGGAIASLVHRETGTELVGAGAALNAAPDAVLSAVHVEAIAGVGTRIVARRITPREVVVTTVSVYDDLAWVDIENRTESGTGEAAVPWTFGLATPPERVDWEVPGGLDSALPPVERFRPMRWATLRGAGGTVLLGTDRVDHAWADATGRTVLTAPRSCRFRVGYQRGHPLPDDPWRFGFGMRPLIAVPAPGGGPRTLPTFGRLIDVADPTVAVLAVQPADDGVGVMVFLQELGGPRRDVAVRPGLLAFDGAVLTDLAERDRQPADPAPEGGALVPLEASGYAAVRLLGVRLSS